MLDLRALLNLLLPFIDDNEAETKKKQLTTLTDLYLKQDERGLYVYSNSQYNRCVRAEDKGQSKTIIFKRPYLHIYFQQHLELLLMTVESASNKLYVNWVDVLPITMDRYKATELYSDTVTKLLGVITIDKDGRWGANRAEAIETVPLINGYIDPGRGISYQDTYNVIANHLFREVNDIKWLIYDVIVSGTSTPYIIYLEKVLSLDPIWDNHMWSQLAQSQRDVFANRWSHFVHSQDPVNNTILGKFYFFFSKYHRNAKQLIETGELVLTYDTANLDDEDEEGGLITPQATRDAVVGLVRVPAEEIYTFFYDQIASFRKTWFYYVTKIKNESILGRSYIPDTDIELFVTPKNVYNYCKLLTSYVEDIGQGRSKLVNLPPHWQSLDPIQMERVLVRILDIRSANTNHLFNDWAAPNWFNINKNLLRIYPGIPRDHLPTTNFFIHIFIHAHLVDIIFESMIYHGLLSDFRPSRTITDASTVGPDTSDFAVRKKQMLAQYFTGTNKTSYNNQAYYFVTGLPYGTLSPPYFDYLTLTNQNWTFIYAMNWVSQLNFYHRFAHNRVMYVTGGTGQGKSTQIPKLLMYALVMMDYNANGKIICTEPRVSPTVLNARIIAAQMGVPISVASARYGRDVFTSNYYVQYKHQKEAFIARTPSFLRIVTDGTLLEEIKSSPFLSKSRPDPTALDSNNTPATWMQTYQPGNKYDVVIVDEAHEHNGNMDMILTLMRDAAYVNNSLRLVIVSATMDDDEPIYRRYYRKINDNRAYPLNMFIALNRLDRANTDRRIHISPPGATTQFLIEDIYLTEAESKLVTEKTYLTTGISKTIQVANSTTEKDILLFLAGQKDITTAVKKINQETPPNVIAMGFFSALDEQTKDMITNIHKNLKNYTRHKEDVFVAEEMITRRVPAGTYTRAIIAATNVAEASITLYNLRYVIDTGYAKNVIYDAVEGIDKAVTLPISQSSADQRRGRSGRVAPGVVYHLYSKTKLINNKTAYDIADSNFADYLVPLLKSEPADTNIITYVNDINYIPNLQRLIEREQTGDYKQTELVYEVLFNPRAYLDIITKQYLTIPNLLDLSYYYLYYGVTDGLDYTLETLKLDLMTFMRANHDDYYYQQHDRFTSRAFTGYDDSTLNDPDLQFYIIHPDENVITRNKYTGRMCAIQCNPAVTDDYYHFLLDINNIPFTEESLTTCKFEAIDFDSFILPKYSLAVDDARQQMLLMDIPRRGINVDIHYTDITLPSISNYIRTYYQIQANTLGTHSTITVRSKQFDNFDAVRKISSEPVLRDHRHLLWYTYAMPYYLEDDVLALIILADLAPTFKDWSASKKPGDIVYFTNLHSDPQGDIHFLYNIWLQIKAQTRSSLIPDINQLLSQFRTYRDQYIKGALIPYEQYQVLDRMYNSGELGSRHEFYYYTKQINLSIVDPTVGSHIPYQIEIVAKNNAINPDLLFAFYINYLSLVFAQHRSIWVYEYQLAHNLVDEDQVAVRQNIMEWARYKLLLPGYIDSPNYQYTDWDRIYESYVRAYSMNLMKNEGSYYLRLNKGVRLDPAHWSPKQALNTSILSNKTQFLIYHSEQSAEDTTNPIYLTPTKLSWVFRLNPIYYYYILFAPEYQIDDTDPDSIQNHSIIKASASQYDKAALLAYLEQLDDPTLRRLIRLDYIHTQKN
ncbi:ATP-dependent RNA helicase [uncultured virus]|nr:ATP-dependent RNA helicase [uncultured virus]